MEFTKLALVCICCIALISNHISPAYARNSNPGRGLMAQQFVQAHNAIRDEEKVGCRVKWDEKVAAYARNYARQRSEDCAMVHSNGPYGENLAEASYEITPAEAVRLWAGEKVDYDYTTNKCATGKVCGHYTQVVWKDSTRIGCASVPCKNGYTFITCNYDPPGNYVGDKPF